MRGAATGPVMRRGLAALRAGRHDEAARAFRRALRGAPERGELHRALGAALFAGGDPEGAAGAFREALKRHPADDLARTGLADCEQALGRPMAALAHRYRLARAAPGDMERMQALAGAVAPVRFSAFDAHVGDLAQLLLESRGLDLQPLAPALVSAVALQPEVAAALEGGEAPPDTRLFHLLATRVLVPDERFEELFARLDARIREGLAVSPALARALDAQAALSDCLWRERPPPPPPPEDIERLTEILPGVSEAVRAQYEAHPYPRWREMRAIAPVSFPDALRQRFPDAPAGLARAPRILVAGCGSGQHAVMAATRFRGAEVLAVDLSLAALDWGRKRAAALGVGNIRFAQADIMALGGLEARFDLIEAGGVLHHLADPLAGWRILAGLLVGPGGVMRISLYSRRARAALIAARAALPTPAGPPGDEALREARRAIRALPEDHPGRAAADELDFYSLAGVRDMLFHACEHLSSPAELAGMLEAAGMRLLGFEFPTVEAVWRFHARFGPRADPTDLACWEALEEEHPGLFRNMMQFWAAPA